MRIQLSFDGLCQQLYWLHGSSGFHDSALQHLIAPSNHNCPPLSDFQKSPIHCSSWCLHVIILLAAAVNSNFHPIFTCFASFTQCNSLCCYPSFQEREVHPRFCLIRFSNFYMLYFNTQSIQRCSSWMTTYLVVLEQ